MDEENGKELLDKLRKTITPAIRQDVINTAPVLEDEGILVQLDAMILYMATGGKPDTKVEISIGMITSLLAEITRWRQQYKKETVH
jgi:hypothetical protein